MTVQESINIVTSYNRFTSYDVCLYYKALEYDFLSRKSDFRLSGIVISYRRTGDGKCPGILSYTPKNWVIIPSDMPAEYKDYGYWTVPYFQQKASAIGPSTRALIDAVIQKLTRCSHSEAVLVFCGMRKSTHRKPWNVAVKTLS